MAVGQLTVPRFSVYLPSMTHLSTGPSVGATVADGSVVSVMWGIRSPHLDLDIRLVQACGCSWAWLSQLIRPCFISIVFPLRNLMVSFN